jgi:hypothetical protein
MSEYSKFEDEIIERLKQSNLIKRFSFSDVKPNPDIKIINNLFTFPVNIEADDFGIYYFDENKDKIYCPSMSFSLTESGDWLSDKIPPVPFDIEQSGNVRKADEAEALFCSIIICLILKEDEFKKELMEIASKYDFQEMKPNSNESLNFRELLNQWQDLQSVVINIIVSACKFKISFYKKDIEKFLRDGISEEEVAELRDLEAKIRSVNFEYSEGVLSPTNVKVLTKIERLQYIDARDAKITSLINKSKAGILFKILKLSSEYISPVSKKKIQTWVRKEVDNLLQNKDFSQYLGERSQIMSKLQRRALRFEKNSVRRLNVERYVEDRVNFKFPSKL